MEVIYISSDGEKFEDEWSCREYEATKLMEDSAIKFFTKGRNYEEIRNISIRDVLLGFFDLGSEVCVSIPGWMEDYGELSDILHEWTGVRLPEEHGTYYYDFDAEKWISIGGRISSICEELEVLRRCLAYTNNEEYIASRGRV